MIRCIWQYKISLTAFVAGSIEFCVRYVKSRSLSPLLFGFPALVLTATMIMMTLQADSEESRASRKAQYTRLSRSAMEANNPTLAETYFSRVLALSDDPIGESFSFAKQLYETAGGPDNQTFVLSPAEGDASNDSGSNQDLLRQSLMMIQSLAPRYENAKSYTPAHEFLFDFWQSRSPQTDVTRTLAMQHEVFAAPQDSEPAIRLAKFISARGYHQQSLDLLKPRSEGNADIQILCAAEHARLQQHEQALKCLAQAESILEQQLRKEPANVSIRLSLGRVLAAQGRVLESMLILAEGCQHDSSPRLVDSMIGKYTAWLSGMAPDELERQLSEISRALKHSETWNIRHSKSDLKPLQTSDGQTVSLPGPIVAFHQAMLNGDGTWLVPLLLGTDAAAQAEYLPAVELLREAIALQPEHPMIANNLAWTLLQLHTQEQANADIADNAETADQRAATTVTTTSKNASLADAWRYSNLAVTVEPENLAYRETRGLIAAATNRWQIALTDLETCADRGFRSRDLYQTLSIARQHAER